MDGYFEDGIWQGSANLTLCEKVPLLNHENQCLASLFGKLSFILQDKLPKLQNEQIN